MRKLFGLIGFAFLLGCMPALADWTGKDASLSTITFKNPGTCTAVVCVPVAQLYDGVNVVTLTTAGADAGSNTLTGVPVYSRTLTFNGTTWDRWQGAVTATLAAETTKVIGTVRVASGGIASGAVASGAIASGAYASGSIASGAMVDLGAQADSVCGSSTGSCSMIGLIKFLNNAAIAAIPAGTNLIGKVTNNDGTNSQILDPCQIVATVRTPISISTAANIKIVTGTSAKKTHICGMMLFAAGTTNVGIVEGSGSNCGTSTFGLIGGATAATGPNLTAQAGFVSPPAGYAIASTTVNANDICLINSAAIQVSGYVVTATP